MTKQYIHSGSPYEERYGFSRGVRVGQVVHIAGTAPVPPVGEEVAADAAGQMRRCCEIACEALAALGATPLDVVRTRMFITDPVLADEIGQVHASYFGDAAPAATMVVVAALLEPLWVVEIEVEALLVPEIA